ncbi:hypothetical protein Tco_0226923 [Tanacetum coccineum]
MGETRHRKRKSHKEARNAKPKPGKGFLNDQLKQSKAATVAMGRKAQRKSLANSLGVSTLDPMDEIIDPMIEEIEGLD